MRSQDLILWNSHTLRKNGVHVDMCAGCKEGLACVWMYAESKSDLSSVNSWNVISLSCDKHCASKRPEFRLVLGCWTVMARMAHGVFSDRWRNIEVCLRQVAPYGISGFRLDSCMVCWEVCHSLLCERRNCAGQLKDFVVFAYARWILQDVVCADILGQVSLMMIAVLQDGFEKIDKDRLTRSS